MTSKREQQAQPSLVGRHVYLREVDAGDEALLRGLDTSPEIGLRWRFRGATPGPREWSRSTWAGTLAHFVIVQRVDRHPIGVVALYAANLDHGYATMAAARFEPTQRSPFMMFGLALFVRYVFGRWDLRKVYMELPEYNYDQFSSGLGRVFELEGRLRGHYFHAGEHWDQLILTIDRDAWMNGERPALAFEAV